MLKYSSLVRLTNTLPTIMTDNSITSSVSNPSSPVSNVEEALFKESIEGAKIVSADLTQGVTYPESTKSFASKVNDVEISKYLSRPIVLARGSITNASTLLTSFTTPEDLVTNIIYAPKLKGYLGFRATLVLRFQVNANPFQQGRIIISFHPELQHKQYSFNNVYDFVQLPHVELDLSTETEAVFRIPHVSTVPYFNLVTRTGGVGVVKVTMYGAFATGTGTASCSYVCWGHFEDIEMNMPQAQMNSDCFVAQMGGKTSVSKQEQLSKGPIAIGLGKVSQSASILSGIPLLSSIAAPVSWITSILANAANVWGFSKPLNVNTITRMNVLDGGYDPNVDGEENARSLAFFSNPGITIDPNFFNSTKDEMSLSYLLSKRGYLNRFIWGTSSSSGDQLYDLTLTPRFMYGGATNSSFVSAPTPVCYLSHMFSYYKGDLVFRLIFVKTKYHSGRIMISFMPGSVNGVSSAFTFDQTSSLLRDIVDIRDCTEYSFRVPYMSSTGYTSTLDPYGRMIIHILDPLVVPATCSPNLEVIVEVSAAENFELATPAGQYMAPICDLNLDYLPTAQMNPECFAENGIGGSISSNSGHVSQYCIGEQIMSTKQLILRTCAVRDWYAGTQTTPERILITYDPFSIETLSPASSLLSTIQPTGTDFISIVGAMFNFIRGSVVMRYANEGYYPRVHVAYDISAISNTAPETLASGVFADATAIPNSFYTDRNKEGILYTNTATNALSVLCPQYSKTPVRLVSPVLVPDMTNFAANTTYTCLNIYNSPARVSYEYSNSTPAATQSYRILVSRQAGDDLHFGFFTYCPSFKKVKNAVSV